MKNKKLILSTAIVAAASAGMSTSASAALAADAALSMDDPVLGGYYGNIIVGGTYFGMDTDGSGVIEKDERTGVFQNDGIFLGTAQAASGSHTGLPDGSETPGIDAPWGFFGNTGMHQSTSAINVLSASGNNATLDFSGWSVTWNGIADIPMGAGAHAGNADGVATLSCSGGTGNCEAGSTYILEYSATVPLNDPSNFGGVKYVFHAEGTVGAAVIPVPAAVWLFGSGLLGLVGVARRRKA